MNRQTDQIGTNIGTGKGRRALMALFGATVLLSLGGCMVSETRALPKVHPVQPTIAIPQAELLDVGIRIFDPGLPEGLEDSEAAQVKARIFPDVRKAEARFFATRLRDTLEGSGQWGAVRVIPINAEFVDLTISGRILRSDGKYLEIEILAQDATGRTWLNNKKYQSEADIGSYMSDNALRQRDPFQNLFSFITNDLLLARKALASADLRTIRRVTELRFAEDLAPDAFSGYVSKTAEAGRYQVVRLPADNDPIFERVNRIRERDGALIDTVSDQYESFSEQVQDPYGSWRRYSYDEISKEEKLKGQARTRIIMGAAALIGGVLASSQSSGAVESSLAYSAYAGGMAGILSGLKKRSNAKMHTAAIQELASSFNAEVAPRVVEVEGRTLRLTGTAEDQYREWREMLRELYNQDAALPAGEAPQVPAPPPPTGAAASASSIPPTPQTL